MSSDTMEQETLIRDKHLTMLSINAQIAVVIPCYAVRRSILNLLQNIGSEVSRIYVVDDACPEQTGQYVSNHCEDERVRVLWHEVNQGVGGAVMTGYQEALHEGMDIIVKIDGDGQMDPRSISTFVAPIMMGHADYTKGNRFYDLEGLLGMPRLRLFGNALLSLITKLSSGYWDLFDPTNGYTAIHKDVLSLLPFQKISKRYFFESDMLFRLNILRAVVVDVPMNAIYGDETSHLHVRKIISEFSLKHMRNFAKRLFYNYYLRDMSLASLELPLGLLMVLSGLIYGAHHWYVSWSLGVTTPPGTVMLSAILVILGVQFILAFIGYDIASIPKRPFRNRKFLS